MLRIKPASLKAVTRAFVSIPSRRLHVSSVAFSADTNDLETTSLNGRKFVPKFAQEEHIQINWRKKPRSDPPAMLPLTASKLAVDEAYTKLFSVPAAPAPNDHKDYKKFVKSAKANLHYMKIPKNLRPLIYRAKNADVLEELNILYPNGKPAVPLPPRTMAITSGVISRVINEASSIEEAGTARTFLHDAVIYAPEETSPAHLMALYDVYIKHGGFGRAESMLKDGILTNYLLQESARVGTLRSKVLYRTNHPTKGLRDTIKAIRDQYKIDITKQGHLELPVQLLIVAYLASTGLASDFPADVVQQVRKYKIDPDMTAKREGSTEAALRSRILFKNFVSNATNILETTVAKGISKDTPQHALNDMYLDAKLTLDSLALPSNDWNIDTQVLAKQLRAYIGLLDGADKKAVDEKIHFYVHSRVPEDDMTPEAKAAAEKVASAKSHPEPTYSEEVVHGLYEKEPKVDGKKL